MTISEARSDAQKMHNNQLNKYKSFIKKQSEKVYLKCGRFKKDYTFINRIFKKFEKIVVSRKLS